MNNREVTKELAKGGLIGTSGRFFLKPINLLTSVLIARYVGIENFGLYSLGLSIIIVVNVIIAMGFPMGLVRFISHYRSNNDSTKIKGIIYKSLQISTMVGIIFSLIFLFFSDKISILFFKNTLLIPVLILLGASLPFNLFYNLFSSVFQAYKKINYQSFIINILRPLSFLIFVLIAIVIHSKLNGILYANLASVIITGLVAFYLVQITFPQIKQSSIKAEYHTSEWVKYSIATLFTGFSAMLLMKVDRIMIGYFSTAANVGLYTAAANMAINIEFFLTPFGVIFSPIAAELFSQNRVNELNSAFQNTTRWLLIFTLPVFFVFVAFPQQLLLIFGKEFSAGGIVLIIISISQLINVSTGPVGILLKMTGHQNIDLSITIFTLILNIMLNYFLIPPYGIVGAAIATATSIVSTHSIRLIMVYRYLKLFPYNKATLKPILIAIFLTAVFITGNLFVGENLIFSLFTGILCIVIYFLLNFYKIEEDDKFILSLLKEKFFARKKKRNNLNV